MYGGEGKSLTSPLPQLLSTEYGDEGLRELTLARKVHPFGGERVSFGDPYNGMSNGPPW